jgi:hypothetical protein
MAGKPMGAEIAVAVCKPMGAEIAVAVGALHSILGIFVKLKVYNRKCWPTVIAVRKNPNV